MERGEQDYMVIKKTEKEKNRKRRIIKKKYLWLGFLVVSNKKGQG